MSARRAFTLIELLVVIAIIALPCGIASSRAQQLQEQGQSGGLHESSETDRNGSGIEELASAIIEDKEPIISGADGLWNQKIILAAYESTKTGKTLKIG